MMNTLLSLRILSCTGKKLLINDTINSKYSFVKNLRNLHITSFNTKEIRNANDKIRVGSNKYNLVEGEVEGSVHNLDQTKLFPEEDTPNWIFKGIPYKELPIVNIKATHNNTILSLTDYQGKVLAVHSAGREGFKNTRKGTNVAAQQTAVSFSETIRNKCTPVIRVRVGGLGSGRMAALKGLQLSGIEIISITDSTKVSWCPQRPRKPRRI
ncbi:30S ribosomal protein S11 [Vespa crabro]|uniref:30S ribosomal protein S11 n=1 Tax=Vespa crabro TaxID=7445 RepID=UPI001F01BEB5|nr:30S ribosomal protein S11 [Vespa crabro]